MSTSNLPPVPPPQNGPAATKKPGVSGASIGLGVAALGALAAGFVTLQTARAESLSTVNNPSIVAFAVNGIAIALLLATGYAVAKGRGLAAAAFVAAIWGGGAGFLLNRSIEENFTKARGVWAAERAVNELADICTGKKKVDARAKPFDPSAAKHELVLAVTGPTELSMGTVTHARQGLRIDQADILACVTERTQTVETCTYDGHRIMRRVQTESEIRFLDITSGEKLWETKVLGPMPRACGSAESFVGQSATIQGGGTNYQFVYDQHFGAH